MAGTKFDDSSDPAFEDALLAAAAVAAPPVAAAAAIIETGEDAVEFAGDAAGEVAGAFEDLFGGGDDVPPGTSTFPVDPNAPAPSETAEEANARGDDIRANQAHFNELGGGGGWVFNANPDAHTQADPYLELDTGIVGAGAAGGNAVTAPDAGAPDGAFEPPSASEPHTGIGFIPEGADVGAPDDVFEPVSASDPHTSVGGGDVGAPDGVFEPVSASDPHTSVGGGDVGAPDGVFEPVSASDPHTSVGGGDVGAPDGVFEPVSASDPHTSVGAADAGAPDGVFEPVSASEPHTSVGFVPASDDLPTVDGVQTEVPFGSDMQLNPQPIPPGIDLHPPGPIAPADAEVSLNPQPIPPGIGADIGEPVTEAAASAGPDVAATSIIIVGGLEAAVGADLGGSADAVSLNPQPIPPGIDLHPPSPIAPADAEVSLNPQPIPPGMGADIGEPVADAAASAGPDVADSSIIIVGGTEAPVFNDVATASAEAPVVADVEVADTAMEDVAATVAIDDGPLFDAAEEMHAPIEEQVFADDGLDG